jgi:hypothetical protein
MDKADRILITKEGRKIHKKSTAGWHGNLMERRDNVLAATMRAKATHPVELAEYAFEINQSVNLPLDCLNHNIF